MLFSSKKKLGESVALPYKTIPIMTSANTPEGTCWSSSVYQGNAGWALPYQAFRGPGNAAQGAEDSDLTVRYFYAKKQSAGTYTVSFASGSYGPNAPRTMTVKARRVSDQAWVQITYFSGMGGSTFKDYSNDGVTIGFEFDAVEFSATRQTRTNENGFGNCQLTRTA